jgi:hypothetical protein
MSIFNDLEKDLIKRTKANLDFIDRAKKENKAEVYETTQLFNSLLGIIVNIREKKIRTDNFNDIELNDDVKEEWSIPKNIGDKTLAEFLINLRNAVAHIDISFISHNSGEIKTLEFEHKNKDKNIFWECTFTVEGMHKFINKLCEYIEKW